MIVIFIDFLYLLLKNLLETLEIRMKNTSESTALPFGSQRDILLEPRKNLSEEGLKDILKKCGLKITAQRTAILKALNSGPRYHKTAQDILDEVKKTNSALGFATVYRFLRKLTKLQMISEISMGSGSSCYELKSNQFHYHIACVKCGKIIEFKNQTIENTLKKIVSEKNYKMKNQILEIYVICDSEKCNQ